MQEEVRGSVLMKSFRKKVTVAIALPLVLVAFAAVHFAVFGQKAVGEQGARLRAASEAILGLGEIESGLTTLRLASVEGGKADGLDGTYRLMSGLLDKQVETFSGKKLDKDEREQLDGLRELQGILDAAKKASSAEALRPQYEKARSIIKMLRDYQRTTMQESSDALRDDISASATAVLLRVFLAAVVSIPLAVYFFRKIEDRVRSLVHSVRRSSVETNNLSVRIMDASQKFAETTNQQASAVQETVASIAEMSGIVRRTSEQGNETRERASVAAEKTREGAAIMERMVGAMEGLQRSNVELTNLGSIFSEIASKTRVINDIVFKTQLLSFNASIEAARAGQHGRGFAVVAEEVGNLARMSGGAAKEIHSLLENSSYQVQTIVESTREKVEEGHSISSEALRAFQDIRSEMDAIAEQAQSISQAMREQDGGIQQISSAMNEIDVGTRRIHDAVTTVAHFSSEVRDSGSAILRAVTGVEEYFVGGESTFDEEAAGHGSSHTPKLEREREQESSQVSTPEQPRRDEIIDRLVQKSAGLGHQQVSPGASKVGFSADDPSFKKRVD